MRKKIATGDKRIVRRFLLFPLTIITIIHSDKTVYETRWLETVNIEQKYVGGICGNLWDNIRFVDELGAKDE